MQVVLQGSLGHFPPTELLTFLSAREREGTLDIESGGKRIRLVFVNDRLVSAESSSGQEGAPAVFEAFDCAEGTFTLLDEASAAGDMPSLSLEIPALVAEAQRRAEEGPYADETMLRIVDEPPPSQQVSLTGTTFKLLFRLAGGKKFGALIKELGIDRKELTSRLQQLEQLGLIATTPQEVPSVAAPETQVAGARKTASRERPPVGSLTPDDRPDDVYPLLDAECTIGRAEGNTIVLTDGSVSSSHARILRTESGFVLEDLQSRNGTFVNGDRVTEPRPLADGDLIRFGKIIMTFNIAREAKTSDETHAPNRSE